MRGKRVGIAFLGVLMGQFSGYFSGHVVAAEVKAEDAFSAEQKREAERFAIEQQQRDQQKKTLTQTPTTPTTPVVQGGLHVMPWQAVTAESPCFNIQHIQLAIDTPRFVYARAKQALNTVLHAKDSPIGHCLGINGVNAVITRVQNNLIAQGYVTTRVLAAPQNLKNGTLVLSVVAGTVNQAYYKNTPAKKPSLPALGSAMPYRGFSPLLQLRDIEQSLENLKRVPSVDANIHIVPAGTRIPGESDLEVEIKQQKPWRVGLSVDDSGSKSTGVYQGGATLSLDNPFNRSDLFYMSLGHSLGGGDPGRRGTQNYALHYSAPWGYFLYSLNGSYNQYYQAVVGANQVYEYSGDNGQLDAKVSYLFFRNQTSKSTVGLKGFVKQSKNYIDDTEISVQRRRTAGFEASLNYNTKQDGGELNTTLAMRKGTGMLGALPAPEELFHEGTSRYKLYTADVAYNYPFTVYQHPITWQSSVRAQFNDSRLTPPDRFAIGGRYTVRGFDGQQVLSGEKGVLVRNDFLIPVHRALVGYWGIDYGAVSGKSSERWMSQKLAGTVIGAKGSLDAMGLKGVQYDIFVGTALDKPSNLKTEDVVSGFSLNWNY